MAGTDLDPDRVLTPQEALARAIDQAVGGNGWRGYVTYNDETDVLTIHNPDGSTVQTPVIGGGGSGSGLTTEEVQDAVAAMFAAGTQTRVSLVYDDEGSALSLTTDLLSPDAGNILTEQPRFWAGSQADYDALGAYDPNTIYDVVS